MDELVSSDLSVNMLRGTNPAVLGADGSLERQCGAPRAAVFILTVGHSNEISERGCEIRDGKSCRG